MSEAIHRVSCRGTIDGATRARISLEFPDGGWSGEALPPGQPFPSVTQLFLFNVEAASEEEAIETVREIVEGAGGHVDRFEAELVEPE
jgi:hypothetical protein